MNKKFTNKITNTKKSRVLKIAILCPHIFMQEKILPEVIFSPGELAISLTNELVSFGHSVTIYTPSKININAINIYEDLSLIEEELSLRGYDYQELLKRNPLLFITLARQVQSKLIARAYKDANKGDFDIVHSFMNEEEIGLEFSDLCNKPIVFTHHDPFNYLAKYRSNLPFHKDKNWISISYDQRKNMPKDTNWVGNVYHGLNLNDYLNNTLKINTDENYILFVGRIIEPKGLHLAIKAVIGFNKNSKNNKLKLKIAGKHYSDSQKSTYWENLIEPYLNNEYIEYLGFVSDKKEKQSLYTNAIATIMPSIWDEPFGMVAIESLACKTPIICFNQGALPEIINKNVGIVAQYTPNEENLNVKNLIKALTDVQSINKEKCFEHFKSNFTSEIMAKNYLKIYQKLV